MQNNSILIVEDEKRLAEVLKLQFEESGFQVDIAYDGYIGKQLAEKNIYDLIILDIDLPLINGYDLCREIRKTNSNIPVIMLTALGTSENKLAGFDVGADDYVLKPFDFRELNARVNVFLRRKDVTGQTDTLKIADLEMNLNTKTVTRSDKKINLTAKELSLLEVLLRNKGKVLSRDFIIEQVWKIDFDPNTNIIDVYINYLRNKIDRDFSLKLIHNKFGLGFYCSDKEL